MKEFFSVDGKFYRFISRFWDMVQLNFFWLITSIPIVTIGASTVAAFVVTNNMVDETEGYIAKMYFKAFKENLKQGIPMGILALVAGYSIYLDFQLFNGIEDNPLVFLIFGIVGCFVFTFCFIYAFPLSARYENKFFSQMKNSFRISMKYFLRTILLILVLALEVALFIWNSVTIWIGIFIGPACLFLTTSGFAMYFFRRIESENENSGN